MERFSFGDDVAFVPRGDLLEGVTIAPLTQPSEEGALVKTAIFRFAPGSRIRRHPGTCPQIIAVLEGSGEVSGPDDVDEPIGPGEAVFLHEGEDHELKSDGAHHRGESLDRYRLVAGRPAENP
jgi:quercetin dioxygenase-like cupin family protein